MSYYGMSMTTRSVESRAFILGAALCVALAAGCGRSEFGPPVGAPSKGETLVEKVPVKPRPGATWNVLYVRDGTQAQIGDLRIGLGSVKPGSYVDESGKPKPALLAGLWIYFRGDKKKNKVVDVHAGETVKVDRYALYVEELRTGAEASVRLLVSPAELPSPSGG